MLPSDLAKVAGTDAELAVAAIFLRAGWWVQWRQSYERRDLAVMSFGGVELLEVKNESHYADSGNIAVEMLQWQDSRPSGIAISQSTICIHYFGRECVLYRTQRMRLWIRANKMAPKPFARSDNFNKGILIHRSQLVDENWVDQRTTESLPESHLFKD